MDFILSCGVSDTMAMREEFKTTFKAYRELLVKMGISELTSENLPKRKDTGERWLEILNNDLFQLRKEECEMLSKALLYRAFKAPEYRLDLSDPLIVEAMTRIMFMSELLGDKDKFF